MIAAAQFIQDLEHKHSSFPNAHRLRCILTGSLAHTGHGHSTDNAIVLGLHGYSPQEIAHLDIAELINQLWHKKTIQFCTESKDSNERKTLYFDPYIDIVFEKKITLAEHPNGMIFELLNKANHSIYSETFFSIGGGFISSLNEMQQLIAPIKMLNASSCDYPFDDAASMLAMANKNRLSIAQMKYKNEQQFRTLTSLESGIDSIWHGMKQCVEHGLKNQGMLPGGLKVKRRAYELHQQLLEQPEQAHLHEWLCAYAMAVNEENAAGHAVVTAPTNGAAGVIPAVLYYCYQFEDLSLKQVHEFLLTAAAIGGIIKHKSSISGAEVGCQGEVGSASAMAAAGLCAIKGGTPEQIENAAEIALEHHLGMTCDPVKGLVQIPCIERNGFGALKAYTSASLALRGSGQHIMSLDNCIAAMKQTGLEMSEKYKETALGGLAVNYTEC
jgi:L-serine dehydratase